MQRENVGPTQRDMHAEQAEDAVARESSGRNVAVSADQKTERHRDPWQQEGRTVRTGPVMPSKRQQKRREPKPASQQESRLESKLESKLESWMPVLIGVALAAFATDLWKLAAQWEPWGLRFLFPYALLVGKPELGLSPELTRTLPQVMMWLQFPLEGLLTRLTLRRGVRVTGALGQILFLHMVGATVLFLISGETPR